MKPACSRLGQDRYLLRSISGLEWFGFWLDPDVSTLGNGGGQGGGWKKGEYVLFMMFSEPGLSRSRSKGGAGPSSGLKDVTKLEGLPSLGEEWWTRGGDVDGVYFREGL